jgi:hypothetical protein
MDCEPILKKDLQLLEDFLKKFEHHDDDLDLLFLLLVVLWYAKDEGAGLLLNGGEEVNRYTKQRTNLTEIYTVCYDTGNAIDNQRILQSMQAAWPFQSWMLRLQ